MPGSDVATESQAGERPRWFRVILGYAAIVQYPALVVLLAFILISLGIVPIGRYQPRPGTNTLEQLAASLPETLKFALVEQGGKPYVVWIGRPSGVLRSGPPVYVFDRTGSLVDHVYDAGDSDNRFVLSLYVAAFHAPGITAQEAMAYCRGK